MLSFFSSPRAEHFFESRLGLQFLRRKLEFHVLVDRIEFRIGSDSYQNVFAHGNFRRAKFRVQAGRRKGRRGPARGPKKNCAKTRREARMELFDAAFQVNVSNVSAIGCNAKKTNFCFKSAAGRGHLAEFYKTVRNRMESREIFLIFYGKFLLYIKNYYFSRYSLDNIMNIPENARDKFEKEKNNEHKIIRKRAHRRHAARAPLEDKRHPRRHNFEARRV